MFDSFFEWLKNLIGGNLVLDVSLDTTDDPPVIISSRDSDATGRKIVWRRKDTVNDFEFTRLNDLNQWNFPKQSIDMNRRAVRCSNKAPKDPGAKYPYEIIVTLGTTEYSSTKSGAPPDGKPVIRNT